MFWKFSRGLLYGLKTLWCFFPTTGSCLGAGLREDREAECCAGRLSVVAITPRTPSHLAVTLHWMFSNWTKTLLKILYAEHNGLALLTASKTSSQRSVEFCHCAVLLIIYARRGEDVRLVTEWTRGSEPFCSAAWAHCAVLSSWAREKGEIIERSSHRRLPLHCLPDARPWALH